MHDRDIDGIASCSERTVTRIRANIQALGVLCTQKATGGRHSRIFPHLLDAVLGRLPPKPDLYLDEMAEFTCDEFGLSVSIDSVRTLEHHADKEPAIARHCLTDHLLPCATTETSGFTTGSNSRGRAGDF
jgi:transposase